ncbi:MAG TPA: hypothetical protein GX528_07850 [Firmicutes bacterium]|nr:hypothetical protein [Bacillota bacterium]
MVYGDQDAVVPAEINELVLSAYDKATSIVVPNADHGCGFYSDKPDVTADVEDSLAAFFADNLK